MERTQLFDLMGKLQLYGMKGAFDQIMAAAVKRQHDPQRILGDLLKAEISEKQARAEALGQGVHSADVVLNILARKRQLLPAAPILTPAALSLHHAPAADCARYDSLRRAI